MESFNSFNVLNDELSNDHSSYATSKIEPGIQVGDTSTCNFSNGYNAEGNAYRHKYNNIHSSVHTSVELNLGKVRKGNNKHRRGGRQPKSNNSKNYNDINIAFNNVNGYKSKKIEIKQFLHNEKIQLFALAETFLTSDQGI